MTIMDLCKKCLVKVVCSERCPTRQDFWDTRCFVIDWFSRIALVAASVICLF